MISATAALDVGARGRRARERGAQVAGSAAEVDTSQHGSGSSYRPPLGRRPDSARFGVWHTARDEHHERPRRAVEHRRAGRRAEPPDHRAGRDATAQTPDSAVASELFSTERAFATARRSLDRASTLLTRMSD